MYRILIYLVVSLFLFSSCEEELSDVYGGPLNLKLSPDTLMFDVIEQAKTIKVQGPKVWIIEQEELADWCSLLPVVNYNSGSYITVFVKANDGINVRETWFDVVMGEERKRVKVDQLGSAPAILSNKEEVIIGKNRSVVPILLVTNIEFSITVEASWIRVTEWYTNNETPVKIEVDENTTGADRDSWLVLKQKGGEYIKKIHFTQRAGDLEYVPEDMNSIRGNHKLIIAGGSASSFAEGKGIEKSYDGTLQAHYQSKAVPMKPVLTPVELEYDFIGETSISYLIYTPYAGDFLKNFRETEVWVKCAGEDYVKDQTVMFTNFSTPQAVALKQAYQNPEKVKLMVKSSWNTKDKEYLTIACSEMEFYAAEMKFADIFTDKSYSSLKMGVTLEQIFAMKDAFYMNIAQHLYYGTYPALRIQEYEPYPYPQVHRNGMPGSFYGWLDNVTGISVTAGESVVLFVDEIIGSDVKLCLLNPATGFSLQEFPIFEGVNKYRMPDEGLLYIKYHPLTNPQAEPVKIHIAGGKTNGYYDSQVQRETEGAEALNGAEYTYFDVRGKYAHLIFSTAVLKENAGRLKELADQYDDIVRLQQEFTGLVKYNQMIKNRVCFMATDKDMPHITPNVIACPKEEMAKYCAAWKGNDVLENLLHQLGHVHQHKALSWTNMKEIGCDLNGLYVRKQLDLERLLLEKNIYQDAFNTFFVGGEVFDQVQDSVIKLVPFWQLYLYMSEVKGMSSYYEDVHYQYRTKNTAGMQSYAVPVLSDVANIDFTEFFRAWGFSALGNVKTTKAPYGLQYLTEANIDLFKTVKAVVPGTYTEKNGVITVKGSKNVVAFEVVYKGSVAYVATKTPFTVANYKPTMKIFAIGVEGESEVVK